MLDVRPVIYVIGLLVMALAGTMLLPFAMDLRDGNGHWPVFLECALITGLCGGLSALATRNADRSRLTLQQTFLLTTLVWLVLPIFGALPFLLGATGADATNSFFEAVSGLTTTGATVFTGLDDLPRGLIFWRAILQWLGGIGIIVVAMVFLPELRVGGMQVFRSEGFDTQDKILPRATEIAARVSWFYLLLTLFCGFGYVSTGMGNFDAVVHAMTTIATGGFSSKDASFSEFGAGPEYVAVIFMCLAALPFVRYVQLLDGDAKPLFRDTQVQGFFTVVAGIAIVLTLWLWQQSGGANEFEFRKALFNSVSILTGTGYASADYNLWGGFALVVFFLAGLIGGCAGSTSCSVKVFRYQLLFAAIRVQILQIFSPSGIFRMKFQGRSVGRDVVNSVMVFFVLFFVSLLTLAILLSTTGLDVTTSVSGAAAALGNIGPGLGPEIGPSGNYAEINLTAKWLLIAGMMLGRLEMLAVFVLLSTRFWRT